jgi:hypothetical protein
VGLPDAILFLRISRQRVFQQSRLIAPISHIWHNACGKGWNMGQPKKTQKTIWQHLAEDEKRKKDFFSLLGAGLVVVTFFANFGFRDNYKEKASAIESAIARRDVLEAIDHSEKNIGEQIRTQMERLAPGKHQEDPHIQVLRDYVSVGFTFLTRTEKELSDFNDESWSKEIQNKVNELRKEGQQLNRELDAGDPAKRGTMDEKIKTYSTEVSNVYADVNGKRISLRDTAKIEYEVANFISVGLFLLAVYLKLWSHGLIEAGSAS